MLNLNMFSETVIVLLSILGLCSSQYPNWTHTDEGSWPGLCSTGQEQSPIDIILLESVDDPHEVHLRGPLVYHGYNNVQVTARNYGYLVRWSLAAGSPAPILSGGPLRGNYTFLEFHFHMLSEHAINGFKYPLEIHMVHVKTGLTVPEAMNRPDGLAVIGVMAQVGPTGSSTVLDELIPAVPAVLSPNSEAYGPMNINMTHLFSPSPQAYYTYHGSLTTPQCAEIVTWIVMDQPTLVSHENYKNLTRLDLNGINNDRRIQPINQRVVYRSKDVPSCSHALTSSKLTWAIFFACFSSKMSTIMLTGLCKVVNLKKKLFGIGIKECDKY